LMLCACGGAAGAGPGAGPTAADTVDGVAVTVHDTDNVLILDIGPIPLPAAASGHVMPTTPLLAGQLPRSGLLTRFDVELRDTAGRRLPRHMLHHVNVMLPGRRDLFRPIMQRLVAGSDTGSGRTTCIGSRRCMTTRPVTPFAPAPWVP
jgi:hypothetical protein